MSSLLKAPPSLLMLLTVSWAITWVLIAWSLMASLDASQRLNERQQVLADIAEAVEGLSSHESTIVGFLKELAVENDWKIPVDENGAERWPPAVPSVVIVVPER